MSPAVMTAAKVVPAHPLSDDLANDLASSLRSLRELRSDARPLAVRVVGCQTAFASCFALAPLPLFYLCELL